MKEQKSILHDFHYDALKKIWGELYRWIGAAIIGLIACLWLYLKANVPPVFFWIGTVVAASALIVWFIVIIRKMAKTPSPSSAVSTSAQKLTDVRFANQQAIQALLAKVQSRQCAVSQCLTEAIPIAKAAANLELERFCRSELTGYDSSQLSIERVPKWRVHDSLIVPIGKLAMTGVPPAGIDPFDLIEHQSGVVRKNSFFDPPVPIIESQGSVEPGDKAIISREYLGKHFSASQNFPDVKMTIYFKVAVLSQTLESVRAILTQYLLELADATSLAKEN